MDDKTREQEIPQIPQIPHDLYFPKTISHKVWEKYLGRYLTHPKNLFLKVIVQKNI